MLTHFLGTLHPLRVSIYTYCIFYQQITSSSGRKVVVLQADSKHRYEEWLATLQNIAAGLYLHDDPKQAILDAQSQNAALPVASPTTDSISGSQEQLSSELYLLYHSVLIFARDICANFFTTQK